MLTEPHPSLPVATPVTFVVVTAGHSSTTLVGAVMLGGVMSRTVIVCRALALLPQASVAVQVRAITFVLAQLVVTTSLKLMLTLPQPSEAVATPVTFVVVTAGHSSTRFVGATIVGGVVSCTVIVCTE